MSQYQQLIDEYISQQGLYDEDYQEKDLCATCPYAKACEEHELWWGCGYWEFSMGEDL